MQGYNAQAVCTERQIVIAAEVTVDSPDFGHLQPMIAATETELAAAGITTSPEVVLADAGLLAQRADAAAHWPRHRRLDPRRSRNGKPGPSRPG